MLLSAGSRLNLTKLSAINQVNKLPQTVKTWDGRCVKFSDVFHRVENHIIDGEVVICENINIMNNKIDDITQRLNEMDKISETLNDLANSFKNLKIINDRLYKIELRLDKLKN
jgi:hypothetical protein